MFFCCNFDKLGYLCLITYDLLPFVTAPRCGKQRRDDDDEEEDNEGEGLRASEVVRREMGLEWMLKPASSSRTEGSAVGKDDNIEKDEAVREEVMRMTMHFLTCCFCRQAVVIRLCLIVDRL